MYSHYIYRKYCVTPHHAPYLEMKQIFTEGASSYRVVNPRLIVCG